MRYPIGKSHGKTIEEIKKELGNKIANYAEKFAEHGYKISKRTESSINAIKDNASIRVRVNAGPYGQINGVIALFQRTHYGGWTRMSTGPIVSLDTAFALAEKIPKQLDKNFDPLPFLKEESYVTKSKHHSPTAYSANFLRSARVKSIVNIGDDGRVTTKEIHNPNKRPWFLIKGRGVCDDGYLRECRFVSDGEDWCPIRRVGSAWALSYEFKNVHYDEESMNMVDQRLVKEAIASYFEYLKEKE